MASRRGRGRARDTGGLIAFAITAILVSGCSSLFGLTSGSAGNSATSSVTPGGVSGSVTPSDPPGSNSSPAGSAGGSTARPDSGTGVGSLPLAGKVVGVDPGHNGGNFTDAAYIAHVIWNGREVPMVLIEVGNMRNATDAVLQITPAFQQEVAKAILAAIVKFLT